MVGAEFQIGNGGEETAALAAPVGEAAAFGSWRLGGLREDDGFGGYGSGNGCRIGRWGFEGDRLNGYGWGDGIGG